MNQYLEKIASFEKQALRRIITELAKGKVSMGLDKLVQLGAVKPVKTYTKGMRLGNDNLAKKLGTIIQKPSSSEIERATSGSGYLTIPGRERDKILASRLLSNQFPTKHTHQGMIRHELFEAMEARAAHKAGTMGTTLNGKPGLKATAFTQEISPGVHIGVGLHISPRVLARESELVRKNPYLSKSFKRIRGDSGEADTIERLTGKKYGVDKMTGKDYYKAHTATPDTIINYHGTPTAALKYNPVETKKKNLTNRLVEQYKKMYGHE